MPLGPNTQNITVNLLIEEKRAFGRAAFQAGMPLGAWIRRCCLKSLGRYEPENAARLAVVRSERDAANRERARLAALNRQHPKTP